MNSSARDLFRGACSVLSLMLGITLFAQPAPVEKSNAPGSSMRTQGDSPFGSHVVPAGSTQSGEVVSIWGVTTIDGELDSKAVSVFGKTIINGETRGEAIAAFGELEINGHVGGRALSVFGPMKLGAKSVVEGDVIVVCGTLEKDPEAQVKGELIKVMPLGNIPHSDALTHWVKQCLLLGRPLSFDSNLSWIWIIAGLHLAFYVLLALVFRRGVVTCAETLEQSPGRSIVAAFLSVILTPLVLLLLAITGIGALVIPFLAVGLFIAGLFGRVALHAWCGRLITRHFGSGVFSHAAVSVLLGGMILSLFYCVPVLGIFLYFLIGLIGFGVVVSTLIQSKRNARPEAVPALSEPAVILPAAVPAHGSPSASAVLGSLLIHSSAKPVRVPLDSELPRAGFWQRMGALVIDIVVCGILASLLGSLLQALPFLGVNSDFSLNRFFLILAVYSAVMWKLRAATLGGIIFHLKVVRLDDEPLDWTTAIVRSLSCFISLAAAGLGFLWIAIDRSYQSWHDKIAGTVVVHGTRVKAV